MRLRDFALLALVCLLWALSNVLSRVVVGQWGVPPLFFAGLRFALVALATVPWLRPVPRPFWRLAAVSLCMGAGNFALLFSGLQTATASSAAVVLQLGVPFTTLLSVLVLHERIRWRRAAGIALTLAGVLLVTWRPGEVALSTGLLLVAGAAFSGSLGAVLMKQMESIPPLRFQAWVGLLSAVPLSLASAMLEHGQWAAAVAVGWPFWAALAFSVLAVSLVAHTAYFWLIGRYEANLLAPLTLMTPLGTIALGVALTGDRLDGRMVAGSALALAGVVVVALRSTPRVPLVLNAERA